MRAPDFITLHDSSGNARCVAVAHIVEVNPFRRTADQPPSATLLLDTGKLVIARERYDHVVALLNGQPVFDWQRTPEYDKTISDELASIQDQLRYAYALLQDGGIRDVLSALTTFDERLGKIVGELRENVPPAPQSDDTPPVTITPAG